MLNYHSQPTQTTTKYSNSRHILDEIVEYKQQEVAQRKEKLPLADLKLKLNFAPNPRDFRNALRENSRKPSIIAEVKKASPSKGVIRADFEPVKIAQAYEQGGASCISVLTDEKFFQGSFENLRIIRNNVSRPLLCKEFIIDPYQIYLARVNGADAILLIAAILSNETLKYFLQIARDLGMVALIEVHTLAELDRVLELDNVELIGINNRNLQDFSLDLKTTQHLLEERRQQLSSLDITVVSESGLYTSADLNFVAQAGAEAVLIGESLVKQADLVQAIKQLLIN
ncbi:indole-3-glycerol phosphate synthase TrpC [Calothrix sp. FACHB-1219]|uniref:indole-3-glycerol phosphate synthase TrpC n=1 Tax=unclassified Calothrix TaxID=2619626 RepID=UPI001681CC76|nr:MULTISPECIES: indole-3-glycerol phosphate synthase TrpC [unclassified Calothrix]MBD2202676.1 indole-3-glycerol phosphate synthase TrpC [Calothrix sp. FACHB-168]MBD2218829.1 indole-3-glycerol phosphate synthase TrpC [Calothrix sp. FACHB-1219]